MAISDLERQRQENIARNNELLKQLNLDTLSSSVSQSLSSNNKRHADTTKRSKIKKPKKEPSQPTRRSRRLAGIDDENEAERVKFDLELEKEKERKEELERLSRLRLNGEFKLIDILAEEHNKNSSSSDEGILERFKEIGKSFSMGDFYETISKKEVKDTSIAKLRNEFNGMSLLPEFDPNDIKLTMQRMTCINFHPSTSKKLVFGGDTAGHLGIWSVDDTRPVSSDVKTENEAEEFTKPEITILKNHGKSISKIIVPENDGTKIISSSYDSSIRSIDLSTMKSLEIMHFDDEDNDPIGISDISLISNQIYFTTLSGQFGQKDLRVKNSNPKNIHILHDKKIGSFSTNPSDTNQIATASLDRTMKLWDLRNTKAPFATYTSRLSISCTDWNRKDHIVCNGYDDTINVFHNASKLAGDVKSPTHQIRHNCQTGRWVSILKAKWQLNPSDGIEKFAIGDMKRSIDIFNEDGAQIGKLTGSIVGAVPAVVSFHPTQNWVVGGSASGKCYFFM